MDILTLAQLNKLKRGGGVGHTESNTVTFPLYSEKEPDVITSIPEYGVNLEFFRVSPSTPTKEELLSGNVTVATSNGESLTPRGYECKTDTAGNLNIQYLLGENAFYIVVAYNTGKVTSEVVTGVYAEFDIPYVGIYVVNASDLAGWSANLRWETIHPIDPKFIPAGVGGGLPVVEITTQPTEEGAVLTAEESAMLDEAAAKGLPIVVKMPIPLPYGEAQVAQVFYFQTVLHLTSFLSATAVAASFYAFEYDGEEWLFIKAAE